MPGHDLSIWSHFHSGIHMSSGAHSTRMPSPAQHTLLEQVHSILKMRVALTHNSRSLLAAKHQRQVTRLLQNLVLLKLCTNSCRKKVKSVGLTPSRRPWHVERLRLQALSHMPRQVTTEHMTQQCYSSECFWRNVRPVRTLLSGPNISSTCFPVATQHNCLP